MQDKNLKIARSHIVSIKYFNESLEKDYEFHEWFTKFWIEFSRRWYYYCFWGWIISEKEMESHSYYKADSLKNVYNKASIVIRTSDGNYCSKRFNTNEDMMIEYKRIMNGRSKFIDVTSW